MKKSTLFMLLCAFAVQAEPVNINKADAQAISASLKGIGPKKAEAIVDYRNQHGGFKNLKELENVKGVGAKTLQAIAGDIRLTDAPAAGKKPDSLEPKRKK
ncbi:MAG: helix-hairpin-helix domain-containing protein [Methylococcales bacterium]|nr:helix-hairpin-helix domain-containing protein [Methylococcales bacterium]